MIKKLLTTACAAALLFTTPVQSHEETPVTPQMMHEQVQRVIYSIYESNKDLPTVRTFKINPKQFSYNASMYIYSYEETGKVAYGELEINIPWLYVFHANDSVIAILIGHEIGHLILKDNGKKTLGQQAEMDADRIGIELAKNAGYDICQAPKLIEALAAGKKPSTYKGSTHPSPTDRLDNIKDLLNDCSR